MVQSQGQIFSGLSTLLSLPEKDWENELPTEQYFSLVLAYNDKLCGLTREKSGKGQVYSLSDAEKSGLEFAYKSGQSGNFREESVTKSFAQLCIPAVSAVLTGKGSRREKLEKLYQMTVLENMQKPAKYSKIENERLYLEDQSHHFANECETLNFYGNKTVFDHLQGLSREKTNEVLDMINKEVASALEGVYTYVSVSVSYVVDSEVFQRMQLAHEAV